MDLVVLQRRIASAAEYFAAVTSFKSHSWIELYARHREQPFTMPEQLAMLNPFWLAMPDSTTPMRRSRVFSIQPQHYESCSSELIWGYRCSTGEPLEVDHLFPWGLGGPTIPENAAFLCRAHNQAKGHDIHLIPWEDDARWETWVPNELSEVSYIMSRAQARGV